MERKKILAFLLIITFLSFSCSCENKKSDGIYTEKSSTDTKPLKELSELKERNEESADTTTLTGIVSHMTVKIDTMGFSGDPHLDFAKTMGHYYHSLIKVAQFEIRNGKKPEFVSTAQNLETQYKKLLNEISEIHSIKGQEKRDLENEMRAQMMEVLKEINNSAVKDDLDEVDNDFLTITNTLLVKGIQIDKIFQKYVTDQNVKDLLNKMIISKERNINALKRLKSI